MPREPLCLTDVEEETATTFLVGEESLGNVRLDEAAILQLLDRSFQEQLRDRLRKILAIKARDFSDDCRREDRLITRNERA